jgi:hypothetical protein
VDNGVETIETFENDVLKIRTVNGQGSILRNSISAEIILCKFLALDFGQSSTEKQQILIYPGFIGNSTFGF